jgi:cation:H+ antiporter
MGNVIGSNIANIALILGFAAVVRPIKVQAEIVKREAPVMIGATVLFWLLVLDGSLSRLDGIILTFGWVTHTFYSYWQARTNKQEFVEKEYDEALPEPTKSVWLEIGMLILGLGILLVGAQMLLNGAVTVAEQFGISQIVIGLTIVAVGTSLPELATSTAATLKNEPDVALGNAIGSNIVNIFCILGITALIQPINATEARTLDIGIMLGTALVGLLLMRTGFVLNRIEGGFLLFGYAVYIYTLLT